MYSGHPHGLFPSHANAPRVVVTNGMVIPNYSSQENLQRMFATGVSMYGQMTAGSCECKIEFVSLLLGFAFGF